MAGAFTAAGAGRMTSKLYKSGAAVPKDHMTIAEYCSGLSGMLHQRQKANDQQ